MPVLPQPLSQPDGAFHPRSSARTPTGRSSSPAPSSARADPLGLKQPTRCQTCIAPRRLSRRNVRRTRLVRTPRAPVAWRAVPRSGSGGSVRIAAHRQPFHRGRIHGIRAAGRRRPPSLTRDHEGRARRASKAGQSRHPSTVSSRNSSAAELASLSAGWSSQPATSSSVFMKPGHAPQVVAGRTRKPAISGNRSAGLRRPRRALRADSTSPRSFRQSQPIHFAGSKRENSPHAQKARLAGILGWRQPGSNRRPPACKADVLCQPPGEIADVGLPSSASRSALRAAGSVTAAPSIRWVAARSGRAPDGVRMVTVMCCCRPRCLAGS